MNGFCVKNFGQIADAQLDFGDLTLFIGPQASGKSILLQLFKLINDFPDIGRILKKHGFSWETADDFLGLYFGENMGSLWNTNSRISFHNKNFDLRMLIRKNKKPVSEKLFYIPAQRVMTLDNGWPKAFTSFRPGDPYIVRNFSEHLRLLMEAGLGGRKGTIFPREKGFKKSLKAHLDHAIFHGARAELDSSQLQRRIVLKVGGKALPYMTWSAGQREFMPLLLGLYWLIPSAASTKKEAIQWVVIEEPEMGLHPQAIISLLLLCLELIHRGYKLIISSHSPVIPQAVWAIQNIKDLRGSPEKLFDLFQLKKEPRLKSMFEGILQTKIFKTYYFNLAKSQVTVKDISSLDPGDDEELVADWGGLTSFSSRASEVVASLGEGQD